MTILNKKKLKPKNSVKNNQAFRAAMIVIALLLFMLALSLTGCRTNTVYVPIKVRHDSIVEKTIHDTLLRYLPQKQSVIAKGKSYLKTDLAFSNAWVDSAGLHHDIENFGTVPGKVIHDKTVVHDSVQVPFPVTKWKDRKITITKYVYKHDFIWWFGLISLAVITLYVIYRLSPKKWLLNIISKLFK